MDRAAPLFAAVRRYDRMDALISAVVLMRLEGRHDVVGRSTGGSTGQPRMCSAGFMRSRR